MTWVRVSFNMRTVGRYVRVVSTIARSRTPYPPNVSGNTRARIRNEYRDYVAHILGAYYIYTKSRREIIYMRLGFALCDKRALPRRTKHPLRVALSVINVVGRRKQCDTGTHNV